MVLIVLSAVILAGCSQPPKAANSEQAIQQASNMPTNEGRINYLISEANAFIDSKKFDEAINIAQYVLAYLDKQSQEAQSILEKAKTELAALAKEKAGEIAGEMKGKLGIGQ